MSKVNRSGTREVIFKVFLRCLAECEAGRILWDLDDVYGRTVSKTGVMTLKPLREPRRSQPAAGDGFPETTPPEARPTEEEADEDNEGEDVVFVATLDKDANVSSLLRPGEETRKSDSLGQKDKVLQQGPVFPWQNQGPNVGATTPNSWIFMTMRVDDLNRFLSQQKHPSKKAPRSKTLDVPALVEVVRNLTNDYDNVNFVRKLNHSLLRMDLPTCYDEPMRALSKAINSFLSSNVALVVLATVSVLFDTIF